MYTYENNIYKYIGIFIAKYLLQNNCDNVFKDFEKNIRNSYLRKYLKFLNWH